MIQPLAKVIQVQRKQGINDIRKPIPTWDGIVRSRAFLVETVPRKRYQSIRQRSAVKMLVSLLNE